MRLLAHLSDLHFGTDVSPVKYALADELRTLRPDLVIISGDLTQRARTAQFLAAKSFLSAVKSPWLAVPGNHDIPLFNFLRRLISPFARYSVYVDPNAVPFWTDGMIAVLGINTVRNLRWKEGRVSRRQIETIRTRFCSIPQGIFKVLVTHHPLVLPTGKARRRVSRRTDELLTAVKECGLDLALAGHLHESYSAEAYSIFRTYSGSVLTIQAGTACSGRIRSEPNAFNLIRIDGDNVRLDVLMWDGHQFRPRYSESFARINGIWTRQ